VFGNLDQLQRTLESYVARSSFKYFTITTVTEVDDTAFKARTLNLPEANAVRADLLAYNQRTKDARALLESVLRDDPNNVLAHETMGYLEFRENNLDAALKWYERAVKLDSQSYLAHYYFASISMREGLSTHAAEAETSLRTAIKLNPNFAPAYDQLAVLYGMQHEKLDEAHILNIQAVQLDPSNLGYRMNTASVLLESARYDDAIAVLQNAISSAKTPEEMALVQNRIGEIQHFQAAREQAERANQDAADSKHDDMVEEGLPASEKLDDTGPAFVNPPKLKYPLEMPHGPRHVVDGVIRGVRCTAPAQLELKVESAAKGFRLYSNNYFKIDFTAVNYKPRGEIHPCTDLEGMKARVQYSETSSKSIDGQILSIELSK
jgi:tetratricopeptide (TPR) repeat protein